MVIQKLRGGLNGFDINNFITALERRCGKLNGAINRFRFENIRELVPT